ncbi:MAG: GAF domain-containing protein, partial [bacterium]|nr:GAF domain-containing protein [bacterium]
MSAEEGGRSRERLLIDSAARINRALERERIFEAIRDLAADALHAEACSVLLLNRDLDRWEYHVAYNKLVDPTTIPPLNRGEGLVGWVGLHEKPAVVNDPDSDPRLRHVHRKDLPFRLRSIMAVPLARAGRV